MKYITKVFLLIAILNNVKGRKLPSFVQKCKYTNSKEISKCIAQRMEDLRSRLGKGVPELKIPALDPLVISRIDVDTDIGIKLAFKNISVYGIIDIVVKDFSVDFEGKSSFVDFFIPFLHMAAVCDFDVKMPILTISSSGSGRANVTDIEVKGNRKFSLVEKKGKTYLKIGDKHDEDITYGKANVYFEKLFGDYEELTERINQLLNENFDEIAKNITPLLHQSVISLLMGILQSFWNEYSLEEAFEY